MYIKFQLHLKLSQKVCEIQFFSLMKENGRFDKNSGGDNLSITSPLSVFSVYMVVVNYSFVIASHRVMTASHLKYVFVFSTELHIFDCLHMI